MTILIEKKFCQSVECTVPARGMTDGALFRQEPRLAEMHPRASVRQFLKTNDNVGLDSRTIFMVRSLPGEREFQTFGRRYDKIPS